MDEPIWITTQAVAAIHTLQLAEHGGQDGVRDPGMLDSALSRPQHRWAYAKCDIADIAAAYAYGLAKNHPFVDGNKRTAGVVCETFLVRNGHHLNASSDEWYSVFYALASGELDEQGFAVWLRERTTPLD